MICESPTARTASRSGCAVLNVRTPPIPRRKPNSPVNLFACSAVPVKQWTTPGTSLALPRRRDEIVERFPLMIDDRKSQGTGVGELLVEHSQLIRGRAIHVMVVEPGLADRDRSLTLL